MIRMENPMGLIEVSQEYFNEIIGDAVSGCFGVAGMGVGAARQAFPLPFRRKKKTMGQAVRVFKEDKRSEEHTSELQSLASWSTCT